MKWGSNTWVGGGLVGADTHAGMVDPDGFDDRRRQAQAGEIRCQVSRAEAATEFDDCDALTAAVQALGEVVELGERRWRERSGGVGLRDRLCRRRGGDRPVRRIEQSGRAA